MADGGIDGFPGGLPPAARLSGLDELASGVRHADADEAGRKFEELLASLMVKELRRALPDGLFGKGPGADVYEGWFDQHLGESLARSWDLDVAGIVRTGIDQKVRAQDAARGDGPAETER